MDVALQFGHTLFLDRHVGKKRVGHFQMFENWLPFDVSRIVFDGKKRAAKLFRDIHDPEQFAAELIWPRAMAFGQCIEPLTPTQTPRPPEANTCSLIGQPNKKPMKPPSPRQLKLSHG